MNKKKLIGIAGAARSGKDTLGRVLKEKFGEKTPFVRAAFADPLKKEINPFLLDNFGIDVFRCRDQEKEIVRPLLIGHGEARRKQNPMYWVDKLFVEIDKMGDIWVDEGLRLVPVYGFCITDVRYLNEAQHIKEKGGKIIFLERAGNEPTFKEKETLPDVKKVADKVIYAENFDSEVRTLKFFNDLIEKGELDGLL